MFEMDTSSLMSGEGKPPAASRSRSSALPRLYVRPNGADHHAMPFKSCRRWSSRWVCIAPLELNTPALVGGVLAHFLGKRSEKLGGTRGASVGRMPRTMRMTSFLSIIGRVLLIAV